MPWQLRVAKRAQKALEKIPAKDQQRILAVLEEMKEDPFSGNVARLKSQRTAWRRRVGSYRLFFDVYPAQGVVDVVEITRRTTITY